MNKYQRAALITVGAVIAVIQLYGIANDGLSESRGWAVSFLIAALLLFVGFGSREWLGTLLGKTSSNVPLKNVLNERAPLAVEGRPRAKPVTRRRNDHGIHISELDIAIETHITYAEQYSLWGPLRGNGRSCRWNCCASVYGSMRYAARKTAMNVHLVVWNSIRRSIEVRMATEEVSGVGMGDPEYAALERDAIGDLELIEKAVEDVLASKGSYPLEPLVQQLMSMFGTPIEGRKPLAAILLINSGKAEEKILPELLDAFA